MCGITGILGEGNIPLNWALIDCMMNAIGHRGPDGRGEKKFDKAILGHVRLAIIDVEGGVQPMSTPDDRFHIIFNGELYNYRELRNELKTEGVTFSTSSDTEVVLKALVAKGTDVINKFRGMFAIALWDNLKKEGLLVRDRFGIKPLFYLHRGLQLIFGSEIKAVVSVLPEQVEMDLLSLHRLLNFRYIPGERTLFSGVRNLSPGHFLRWVDGKSEIHCWEKENLAFCDQEEIGAIAQMVKKAVCRQLVSDVGIGSYLSGGIDSATITAIAAQELGPNKVPTFTIKTGDDPFEAQNALRTSQLLGVKNIQKEVNEDLCSVIKNLIFHLEVPKVNAYQSALVAKLAARHVKVSLSGLGGDEIFLGYNMHSILALSEKAYNVAGRGLGCTAKCLQRITKNLGINWEERTRGLSLLSMLPDFSAAYGIIRNIWDSNEMRRHIYGPQLLSIANDLPNCFDYVSERWSKDLDSVAAAARFELKNKMINDLLLQEDRLSMAFGLEVRVPFLDEDLVSSVLQLSTNQKMPKSSKKGLMKEVVSEWLPKEVLSRPKSGFQLPIADVFNDTLRPLCAEYLSKSRVKDGGLFNYDFIERTLSAKPNNHMRWHYHLLFLMLGTVIWRDVFINKVDVGGW